MDELTTNEAQELEASSQRWRPRQLAFKTYTSGSEPAYKAETLRVVVRRPVSVHLDIFCFLILFFFFFKSSLLNCLIAMLICEMVGFSLPIETGAFFLDM